MPDSLSWGNVSLCRLLRRHVFSGSDMIGHRSAGAADGVALYYYYYFVFIWIARSLNHHFGWELHFVVFGLLSPYVVFS